MVLLIRYMLQNWKGFRIEKLKLGLFYLLLHRRHEKDMEEKLGEEQTHVHLAIHNLNYRIEQLIGPESCTLMLNNIGNTDIACVLVIS